MNGKRLAAVVLGVWFSGLYCAGQVHAQSDNRSIQYGADLERLCNSALQQDMQECSAYIVANIELVRRLQDGTSCFFYDPPPGLSPRQAIPILRDWLHDHRDRGEIAASYVFGSAMEESFPCKK